MIARKDEERWANAKELIEYAKQNPGKVSFSVNGTLNDAYLGLKIIEDQAGVKFNIIPFEGGNPARMALVGKHVDASQTQLFSAQHVWNDTKILGVVWDKNDYPDLTGNAPVFNEATGLNLPNLGQTTGFIAPVKLKEQYPERYEKLVKSIEAAMKNPEYLKKLEETGQAGKGRYLDAEATAKLAEENMQLLEKYKQFFVE
jgi:putative tricarboxylic transport membrane protein